MPSQRNAGLPIRPTEIKIETPPDRTYQTSYEGMLKYLQDMLIGREPPEKD